jgi:hypothetical protein
VASGTRVLELCSGLLCGKGGLVRLFDEILVLVHFCGNESMTRVTPSQLEYTRTTPSRFQTDDYKSTPFPWCRVEF